MALPGKPSSHGKYIKSIIYGGLDGVITTFAVVAGVAGASLSAGIVLILGFANLIGDGISMSVGDYLSSKSQKEYEQAQRKYEASLLAENRSKATREIEKFYRRKGFGAGEARRIASLIAVDTKAAVDVLMAEKHGVVESVISPTKNALYTFASFVVFGFLPLLTYVANMLVPGIFDDAFAAATLLTAATLFALGAMKVFITSRSWLASGIEMLIVGGVAAASAYAIGYWLASVV
ncbi:MAG: VIT1/CCC1 transporter family protein [Candidatus Aenigmarchaeota archaeon]|nr:VIT1/CCC1 transporter family protein [Candidatus Aenigmarchaeota archaeon]